jgi:glycosyltransferase involved in cell wall biosynthesis
MIKLSVVVITLNEEDKIGACLESVQGLADEIVVLDSFSKDRTKEISLSYGAVFIEQGFAGYIEQKNIAMARASHDYVLSLDADEVLSPELRNSILAVKEHWTHDAYTFNRITNYCGYWVKHCGWYPDKKLRLADRRLAKWFGEGLHERLETAEGVSVCHLKGDLLHYSFDSIEDHLLQINHFTNINSRHLFENGKKVGLCKVVYSLPVRFIRDYFLKLGILDGYYGFLICSLSAWASMLKYAKLRQLWIEKNKAG